MASMRKVGSRIGKTKVRFELNIKVKDLLLPRVANGAKIFIVLERGKTHKNWTKTHAYASSQAKTKNYKNVWENENLKVPITLYRSAQGQYQPKGFKIKVMKDPSGKPADYPQSSENPILATFILDATKFRVMSENESPGTIRAQCSQGKGCVKDATMLLSIACVFDHDSGTGGGGGYDNKSETSSRYSGNSSIRSGNESMDDFTDESEFEQDLSGFGEEETNDGSKKKWWSSPLRKTNSQPNVKKSSGSFLEDVAEVRESQETYDNMYDYDNSPEVNKKSFSNHNQKSSMFSGMRSSMGLRSSQANSLSSTLDHRMQMKAEKEAYSSAVAELLRNIGLTMYIKPIVIDLGYDDYDVLRSLHPNEFVSLANDAGMKPGHSTKLRLRLGISRPRNPEAEDEASKVDVLELVGKWIDVRNIGVGKVLECRKVWNHLVNHSYHIIDFSYNSKNFQTSSLMELSRCRHDNENTLKKVSLLLRRRKLGTWNRGLYFEIVPDPTINS